ncbi:hypothetical protein ACFV5G_15535 [Streptomyces sp. NPDC059766]|uniref:hypothetical protein n=1 Tax=Streptomyces sp. NPDC059766 TaxID=3346940 RepID=UPI00364B709E
MFAGGVADGLADGLVDGLVDGLGVAKEAGAVSARDRQVAGMTNKDRRTVV